MGCKKICKIFASDLGYNLGVMIGFEKGITLGGRISGRVNLEGLQKWVVLMIIVSPPVQTGSQEFRVWSLELGVWSWSWSGLRLDFRLTIVPERHLNKCENV